MRKTRKRKLNLNGRLTVTLGAGQREALEAIAKQNNAVLAFVVRRALTDFIDRNADAELPLRRSPSSSNARRR